MTTQLIIRPAFDAFTYSVFCASIKESIVSLVTPTTFTFVLTGTGLTGANAVLSLDFLPLYFERGANQPIYAGVLLMLFV